MINLFDERKKVYPYGKEFDLGMNDFKTGKLSAEVNNYDVIKVRAYMSGLLIAKKMLKEEDKEKERKRIEELKIKNKKTPTSI